ncbi:MAG: hypothetical protein H0V89_08025 [Deltaproteobacteria bacterium]|nr:hypothetical protein [Deltaproteobacteria bacterium]
MIFVLALFACDPEGDGRGDGSEDDGDSGEDRNTDPRDSGRAGSDTIGTTQTDRPVLIDAYVAACLDDDTYHTELVVTAETSGVAVLDLWHTGAADGTNEEHLLTSTGSGSFGEILELTLRRGAPEDVILRDPDRDGVTGFGCEPGGPFLAADQLTYAVRIYDRDGALADCLAFGHLPGCVVNGDCGDAGGIVSNPAELESCVIL